MSEVKVWFDKQADMFEVIYQVKEGYWGDTNNEAVQVKVDAESNVLDFSVDGVTQVPGPLYVTLEGKRVKVSSLSPEERGHFENSMRENESVLKILSEM